MSPREYWKGKDYVLNENRNGGNKFKSYQGKSWLNILGQVDSKDHNQIFGSHTFHEIQMYYPMRTLRDREYKIIWNIAHPLAYPFASDLFIASTWQAQLAKGKDANFGNKTVGEYVQRPAFELYDMLKGPDEFNNLALDPKFTAVLKKYKDMLKAEQKKLEDPWITKWRYE